MKFTDYLYEEAKDVWGEYLKHPFLIEIGKGTLPKDKFKNYLIQDYLYLIEFARVFAMGIVKSETIEDMKFFNEAVEGTIEDETAVHISYMNKLNISKKYAQTSKYDMVTTSYTSYMQSVSITGDLKALVVSTLPCTWSYNFIGNYIAKNYEDYLEDNFYGDWIKMYADEEFNNVANKWIDYTNKICENVDEKEKEKLKDIFIKSSLYELEFWNMAYK